MASDWEDMCDMFGVELNDPDATDKILDIIHSYDDDEFQMETEYHMENFDATAQFCGHPDYLGIGTWLITVDDVVYKIEALKYCEGECGPEDCDVFSFLCDMDDEDKKLEYVHHKFYEEV